VHYIAGVCSALYMKEALDWAAKNGGTGGENVAKGFYQKKDWVPAGMDGVCNPSTWTEKDHRGTLAPSAHSTAKSRDCALREMLRPDRIDTLRIEPTLT
jgi:branched-chain amino acid transport system substrate-binding protein